MIPEDGFSSIDLSGGRTDASQHQQSSELGSGSVFEQRLEQFVGRNSFRADARSGHDSARVRGQRGQLR